MYKVNPTTQKQRRKLRVRKKVYGSSNTPRLSVFRSNKYIYAQVIDDKVGVTLVSAFGKKDTKAAEKVGEDLAKKAIAQKINKVVFDKGSYKYHGRVKSLAEGARKGGLQF